MTSAPRLRFAPSPTGYLHIGGVRTALFNWLWARKTGGTFILRIEDTDQERSTDENTAIILRELRWLGLEWDEGPEAKSPHAPYFQMQRLPIYHEHIAKLVASGAAYRCYATKEELDQARAELKEKDPKAQFRYPGWWRDKTSADWPADKPYVIRLRVPESGHTGWNDLVFGEQSVPNSAQQDVVLMRSDGVPLYNLGCVVDDITMGITLVARGRDHMVNTPIQILIYQGLGATPPEFAHLPMMLGKGNEKLSKRHGAVSVGEYRDAGFTPVGLLNYLVRFGWSFGDQEVFTMDQLVAAFDWARCTKSDGKFDPQKLAAINFEHLKSGELTSDDDYLVRLEPYLRDRYGAVDARLARRVLPQLRPRAKTLREAADSLAWLFAKEVDFDEKAKAKFLTPAQAPALAALADIVSKTEPFEAAGLEAAVKAWVEANGAELGAVAQPARVALTGKTASPGLFDVIELLGRERAGARLAAARAIAEQAAG